MRQLRHLNCPHVELSPKQRLENHSDSSVDNLNSATEYKRSPNYVPKRMLQTCFRPCQWRWGLLVHLLDWPLPINHDMRDSAYQTKYLLPCHSSPSSRNTRSMVQTLYIYIRYTQQWSYVVHDYIWCDGWLFVHARFVLWYGQMFCLKIGKP